MDGSETHSTRTALSQPLMVALLAVLSVESRVCATEIHPVISILHGEESELV